MQQDTDPSARLIESWRANAGLWSEAIRSGAIASRRLATDRAIVDAVLARRPASLLDVGCGEGWLARALQPSVATVVGVDASPELVARARALGGSARFHQASYAALIEAPDQVGTGFDVIAANFALLDADAGPLLQALRRIAAPAGVLLIQTLHPCNVEGPYRDGWRTETYAAFGGSSWTPMPWYFRTIGSWIAVVDATWGLRSIDEPLHPETQRPASLLIAAGGRTGD